MESEARQNSLSKDKAIEQLRTTVDKLETIIEQLNATSVVDLPSAEPVVTLVTTTEELENAISNLPEETVAPESQTTPISNKELQDSPEVAAVPSLEKPLASESKTPESETIAIQTPTVPEPDKTETTTPKEISQSATTAQTKPTKPKKKKNWLAIAIIALILAIIPISLKYLPIGTTPQVGSEKVSTIAIEEAPLIATNLPGNQLPKAQEIPAINQEFKPAEDISISELPSIKIDTIALTEAPEKPIELIDEAVTEVALVEETESIESEISDSDQPELLLEEGTESIATSQSDVETPIINNEVAKIASVIPEVIEVAEVQELESPSSSIATATIDETAKVDQTANIDNIPESILQPEPKIVFPENLVSSGTEQILELKTVIHDIKLTPEQDLIAALSEQVLQLSEGYQEDIVLSIEPNMSNSILIVKVADDWYQLEATEQDEIVADMLARSQDLEFRKLQITDQNNNLIARSPVVGQNMIIFRRNFLTQTSNS